LGRATRLNSSQTSAPLKPIPPEPDLYSTVNLTHANPRQTSTRRSSVRRALMLVSLLCLVISGVVATPISAAPQDGGAGRVAESSGATPTAIPQGTQPSSVPASRQATNVAIITIKGEILPTVTAVSFLRRLKEAEASGADALVIELDTPGGEVGAVLEICNAIKGSSIPNTVAWVNSNAYSGGALIALACRRIVVSGTAALGDALPIMVAGGQVVPMLEHERQKILAPLMMEVVDSARRNGYDEYLVQGIVSRHVELWYIENVQTGQRLAIDRDEYRTLFGTEPPRSRPRLVSAARGDGADASAPSRSGGGIPGPSPDSPTGTPPGSGTGESGVTDPRSTMPPDVSGPGADLAPEMQYKPASPELAAIATDVSGGQTIASERPVFTEADRGDWRFLEFISDGAGPVVMKHDDLKHYRFAEATINDDAELQAYFGASQMRRLDISWSERFTAVMINPIIRGVLIVIFLIGLFIELTHPGLVLPGAIASIALIGLIGPPLVIGMASWWEIAAIFGGILLIGIEIFVLPGFTLFGAIGLIALFAGLVGTFVQNQPGQLFPSSAGSRQDMLYGVATILLSTLSAFVAIYFISKNFGSLPIFSRLILKGSGEITESDELLAAIDPGSGLAARVGQTGRTLTPLRPAGRAMIEDRPIDVVAEGGFLDAGIDVVVVEASPFRVVVAPREADGSTA
jgi:membrane-bound ClpP family serine protease